MPQYDNHEQSQNVYSVQKTYKVHVVMTEDNPTPQNDDFVLKSSCLVTSEKRKEPKLFPTCQPNNKGSSGCAGRFGTRGADGENSVSN